jgi:hypothetical protein
VAPVPAVPEVPEFPPFVGGESATSELQAAIPTAAAITHAQRDFADRGFAAL